MKRKTTLEATYETSYLKLLLKDVAGNKNLKKNKLEEKHINFVKPQLSLYVITWSSPLVF